MGRGLLEVAIDNDNMFSKTDTVRAGSVHLFRVTIFRFQSSGFDIVHTCKTTRSTLSLAITLLVTRLRNWHRHPEPWRWRQHVLLKVSIKTKNITPCQTAPIPQILFECSSPNSCNTRLEVAFVRD